MKSNTQNTKIAAITEKTLIIGIDVQTIEKAITEINNMILRTEETT